MGTPTDTCVESNTNHGIHAYVISSQVATSVRTHNVVAPVPVLQIRLEQSSEINSQLLEPFSCITTRYHGHILWLRLCQVCKFAMQGTATLVGKGHFRGLASLRPSAPSEKRLQYYQLVNRRRFLVLFVNKNHVL